jgi:hypothetical protein
LINGLPSPLSADLLASLFEWFIGTMPLSDSSTTFVRALRPWPSPAGLLSSAGVTEVSRFSCMKFLGVLWVLRLWGTVQKLALTLLPMLPSTFPIVSASPLRIFEAQLPSPPIPLFTLRRSPHDDQRKTRGRVDRYSFLVRPLHSLLHAGLSRRTGTCPAALKGHTIPRPERSAEQIPRPRRKQNREMPQKSLLGLGIACRCLAVTNQQAAKSRRRQTPVEDMSHIVTSVRA